MSVTVKQQYVQGATDVYAGTNPVDYITVHETGNTSSGADAQAHANYQSRSGHDYNSWHAQADDSEIIESYPDTAMCWHAGDGRGDGNTASIAIEICQNRDGDFAKACDNAAYWVAVNMIEHGVPIDRVVQHHHWSGKNCPQFIRGNTKGVDWADFIAMVKAHLAALKGEVVEKPVTKPSTGGRNFLPLSVDGDFAHKSITELERALAATGDYKGKIEEDHGKRAVFGPILKAALQRFLRRKGYYKGRIDADFVYWSTLALQEFLFDQRDEDGRMYIYRLDGKWLEFTSKGVQRALNARKIK